MELWGAEECCTWRRQRGAFCLDSHSLEFWTPGILQHQSGLAMKVQRFSCDVMSLSENRICLINGKAKFLLIRNNGTGKLPPL